MAQTASLQSPHLETQYDDLIEDLFARGVTDGLPVVPPTEERVQAMLDAVDRDPRRSLARSVPTTVRPASKKSPSTRSWPAAMRASFRWLWLRSKPYVKSSLPCTRSTSRPSRPRR